ncbi:MAG: hypothetical protein LBN38_07340, partial [Verrucomicrobiota bacterium]|nr:hypothetical protein [Verrucomicrobiota bacterium]
FPVGRVSPPFADWFEATEKVDLSRAYDNEVYRVAADGRGMPIVAPHREKVEKGKAYWVKVTGALDYEAPVAVSTDWSGGLDFGLNLRELGMSIQNLSSTRSRTIRITQQDSENPPEGAPELAGPVPLAYMAAGTNEESQLVWMDFHPVLGLTRTLEPGETWHLQWGVQRLLFAAYDIQGANGAAYQSILNIQDAEDTLHIQVPVIAERGEIHRPNLPGGEGGPLSEALEFHHPNEGLWVGEVNITSISCPSYAATNPLPVRTPGTFRMLLHVGTNGAVQLLQRVYLAWEGPETNGQYRLYADETLLPPDSPDVKRLSSAVFPLMRPLLLNNTTGTGLTNQLTGRLVLAFDDPTNPFLHRYHPMFDNKDDAFKPFAGAVESRTVERSIALDFFDPAADELGSPFYGMNDACGTYRETLDGLRNERIQVQGVFKLQRVAQIGELAVSPAPAAPQPPTP